MRVLVLGVSGYLGAAISSALAHGGHDVVGVVRTAEAAAAAAARGARPILGDVRDPTALAAAASACDAVIDATNLRKLGSEAGPPALRLHRTLMSVLAGRQIVLTTGAAILGEAVDRPFDETTRAPPGAWRAELEEALLGARQVRAAVVRPGLVYGHGGSAVLQEMRRVALQLQCGWSVGDGANRWSAIHLDDLAALYRAVVERGAAGVFHGVSQDISMSRLGEALSQGLGYGGRTVALPLPQARERTPLADLLAANIRISGDRAHDLGWRPVAPSLEVELAEGSYAARPT